MGCRAALEAAEYWRVEEGEGEGGEAIVYQYALVRLAENGSATYIEKRVTSLAALETAESPPGLT